MNKVLISPSIMCANLTNLQKSINEIESIGVDAIHVDIIDGIFSPSLPLGIDTVRKIRLITTMDFDAHVMSMNNEFYVKELISIGVQQISFHYESSLHIDRLISLIKNAGIKVGIALNPSTTLSVLDYILPEVDTVLLMLINPGFAADKNEQQVSYANRKVRDLRKIIDSSNLSTQIQVDGRVSLKTIPDLVRSGADNLVVGSTSLFLKENSLSENKRLIDEAISKGLVKDVK